MEINLKQRVIGGVVLVALAVIFVPVLFSTNAPKTEHQALTLEAAIPAQPLRPSRETTINLQGEELNSPKNTLATAAVGNAHESPHLPVTQVLPQVSTQITKSNTSTISEAPVMQASRKKVVNPKLNTQESALLEPVESQATPEVRTVKPVEVKAIKKEAKVTKKVKVITVTPIAVQHKKLPSAKAWVVQLGSFGNAAKAKALQKQLRDKGFTVYSHSIKTSLGSMVRVFVGPEIKREKAEALKVKIEHQLHISGVVVAFQPTKAKKA